MNILMILSSPDKTGLTTHTLDLSSALVQLQHKVTVLTCVDAVLNKEQVHFLRQFKQNGVNVIVKTRKNSKLSKLLVTAAFLKEIITHRWDVIHVQSPYYSFMPWILHRKFVSTLHVNDLIPCFYYKNATHLIAISKETKKFAKDIFGYSDDDITIVNHGVSLRFASELTEEESVKEKLNYNIPTDKILIGLVASIEKRKGHDILLEAIYNLPESVKSRIHVILVGSSKDGRTDGWLKDLVDKYGENRVTCVPYQDPAIFYKLFDIFVLPSRLEGFPLVVIEAMLSNCCVIRSNTEGASEQIISEIDGFIFENENINQLTGILKQVIIDDSLRRKIAKAGKIKALSLFTNETMAKNTVKVYNKIINKYQYINYPCR